MRENDSNFRTKNIGVESTSLIISFNRKVKTYQYSLKDVVKNLDQTWRSKNTMQGKNRWKEFVEE